MLDAFEAHPHRAERDFQNVRIQGRITSIDGNTTREPHLVLVDINASRFGLVGLEGLVVDVSRGQAAEAHEGAYVLVHCRQVVAKYARDIGGGFTQGYFGNHPWCKNVHRVEFGVETIPEYTPPTTPPSY